MHFSSDYLKILSAGLCITLGQFTMITVPHVELFFLSLNFTKLSKYDEKILLNRMNWFHNNIKNITFK